MEKSTQKTSLKKDNKRKNNDKLNNNEYERNNLRYDIQSKKCWQKKIQINLHDH